MDANDTFASLLSAIPKDTENIIQGVLLISINQFRYQPMGFGNM